jgi:hypothetical protein
VPTGTASLDERGRFPEESPAISSSPQELEEFYASLRPYWPRSSNSASVKGDDAIARDFHSPVGDYARRRAQQRAWFRQRAKEKSFKAVGSETVLDPEEYSEERSRDKRWRGYIGKSQKKPKRGDPRERLPIELHDTALTIARRYGATDDRAEQGYHLERFGLRAKARRLVLCGRIGRRLNCQVRDEHKFFRSYFCGGRYCTLCGPHQFRSHFAELSAKLTPVIERLFCEGRKRGREMVIAKLDFTIPNVGKRTGEMPTRNVVRKFHADMRRFWRAAERRFGVKRTEYGFVGCDEFGGNNTNLHRHCCYVGPALPQRKKELSSLWSEIRGERSFVSIKGARSFNAALAHAMKYPGKFLENSSPERLAELERTFHKTRRISTGGAFYNVKAEREPGEDRGMLGECPHCHVPLVEILEPWVSVQIMEKEGRVNLETVRHSVSRAAVISGRDP